jgi:predicted methyltransferase
LISNNFEGIRMKSLIGLALFCLITLALPPARAGAAKPGRTSRRQSIENMRKEICNSGFVGGQAAAHCPRAGNDAETLIERAVKGSWRSAKNKARDRYRHPLNTLEFFGLKPDMTAIELYPEGGWYTAILAPVLRNHGQLIEAGFSSHSKSAFQQQMAHALTKKFKAHPKIYGKVKRVRFSPPAHHKLGPAGSADMVLTFRNLHNWMSAGVLNDVFKSVYTVLRPGGIFGIVEHRAKPGANPQQSAKRGRMPVAYVMSQVQKVGFDFVARSSINANPKDTKNYPKGVWTLPPTYALGNKNRAKYKAIGESDRMTLKFIKPRK